MKAPDLSQWKSQLDTEADGLRAQIAPLVERLRIVTEQQDLVGKLLRLEGRPVAAGSKQLNVQANADVNDIVEAILLERGQPMHISAIRLRYLEAGFKIPGAGAESNLISYMTRTTLFRRVSKGTYALSNQNQQ